ncbi:MAG: hypothetical protein ACRDPF_24475 [Streptosporangiaceae bacterium]
MKYTGVVDLFRIPKPGAAIYQAQADPRVRPVIAPAFYWDFGPSSAVNVGFDVEGPAVLVGDNPFDFAAAGGAGAVWLRSRPGARGTVTVRASHSDLGDAVARIRVG